jgi:ribosomal protein L31E
VTSVSGPTQDSSSTTTITTSKTQIMTVSLREIRASDTPVTAVTVFKSSKAEVVRIFPVDLEVRLSCELFRYGQEV